MATAKVLNESSVERKLQTLTNTQDSIQTLSLWAIHYKAHHERIVQLWFKALKKAKMPHRLTLFYLCNDVVQNSKRKHAMVYKDAFKEVLKDAVLLVRDPSIRTKIERIFGIWGERGIYDEEFLLDLKALLENSKARASQSSKLLAEYKPERAITKLENFVKLETENQAKRSRLMNVKLDISVAEAMKQLKDRNKGREFSNQFEENCQKWEDFVKSTEKEIRERQVNIELLEQSELFYDAQYGEARIVANAYKNFGTRISNLRKKLEEYKKNLPDVFSQSPVPSPSADAPSPVNSPTEQDVLPHDNKDSVDMELSDGENDNPLEKDDGALDNDKDSVGSAPSPVGSPFHMSPVGKTSKNGPAETFSISSLTQGSQASFLSGSVAYDPANVSHDMDWEELNNTESTIEVKVPKPGEGSHSARNLVTLTTEGDGGGTPVRDERSATPLQDEAGGKKGSNPMDFLTQLISGAGKPSPGAGADFLQSLSALTGSTALPKPAPVPKLDNILEAASSDPPPPPPPPMDPTDNSNNSWSSWKSQQEGMPMEPPPPPPPTGNFAAPGPPSSQYSLPPPPPPPLGGHYSQQSQYDPMSNQGAPNYSMPPSSGAPPLSQPPFPPNFNQNQYGLPSSQHYSGNSDGDRFPRESTSPFSSTPPAGSFPPPPPPPPPSMPGFQDPRPPRPPMMNLRMPPPRQDERRGSWDREGGSSPGGKSPMKSLGSPPAHGIRPSRANLTNVSMSGERNEHSMGMGNNMATRNNISLIGNNGDHPQRPPFPPHAVGMRSPLHGHHGPPNSANMPLADEQQDFIDKLKKKNSSPAYNYGDEPAPRSILKRVSSTDSSQGSNLKTLTPTETPGPPNFPHRGYEEEGDGPPPRKLSSVVQRMDSPAAEPNSRLHSVVRKVGPKHPGPGDRHGNHYNYDQEYDRNRPWNDGYHDFQQRRGGPRMNFRPNFQRRY